MTKLKPAQDFRDLIEVAAPHQRVRGESEQPLRYSFRVRSMKIPYHHVTFNTSNVAYRTRIEGTGSNAHGPQFVDRAVADGAIFRNNRKPCVIRLAVRCRIDCGKAGMTN
jgi:hypothetical protein